MSSGFSQPDEEIIPPSPVKKHVHRPPTQTLQQDQIPPPAAPQIFRNSTLPKIERKADILSSKNKIKDTGVEYGILNLDVLFVDNFFQNFFKDRRHL